MSALQANVSSCKQGGRRRARTWDASRNREPSAWSRHPILQFVSSGVRVDCNVARVSSSLCMAEGKQSRPQRLLVVDDDRALARTIKIYLEEAGYAVEVASDAVAARKHLAQRPYDMAIIDLGLPGEDGLSLSRSLREQGEIGLLILTGRQDATDRIVGLEIGADDYVLKPVELRELLARVRSILRRSNR